MNKFLLLLEYSELNYRKGKVKWKPIPVPNQVPCYQKALNP